MVFAQSPEYFLFQFNVLLFSVSFTWFFTSSIYQYPSFAMRFSIIEKWVGSIFGLSSKKKSEKKTESRKNENEKLARKATLIFIISLILFLGFTACIFLKISEQLQSNFDEHALYYKVVLMATPIAFIILPMLFRIFIGHLLLWFYPEDIVYLIDEHPEWAKDYFKINCLEYFDKEKLEEKKKR